MGWQSSSGGSGRGFRHSSSIVQNGVRVDSAKPYQPLIGGRDLIARHEGVANRTITRSRTRPEGRIERALICFWPTQETDWGRAHPQTIPAEPAHDWAGACLISFFGAALTSISSHLGA